MTTGAEADLEMVTKLARQMVGRWGMSRRVGLVSVLPTRPRARRPSADERDLRGHEGARGQRGAQLIDECHTAAIERLTRSRQRLDALAAALLEHETLDEGEAYAAIGFAPEIAAKMTYCLTDTQSAYVGSADGTKLRR